MIFPDVFRMTFIIISILLIVVLEILTTLVFKTKNVYRIEIGWTISVAILSIVSYILFLLTGENHNLAVFFDSMFFIGTDWLAMFMFIFAVVYTERTVEHKKLITILCVIPCTIDSISLFVNNFTHHMFDLVFMENSFGFQYWGNSFKPLHYVHLGMCYIMVSLTFIYFAINCIKEPAVYKRKYHGIFVAYVIVIAVNCICYSINLPIDFSVILYAVLAGFICYFSTFTFPHQLLNQTLSEVNEKISDGIVYYDIHGHCIYANKSARKIFARNGKFDYTFAEEYRLQWIDQLGINDESFSIDKDTFIIDGKEMHYSIELQKEYSGGVLVGYCLKMADKTFEINNYLKELYIATHDELTGLLNRTGFFETVEKFIKKEGSEVITDTMMLCSNIKDFKLINSLFGEQMGDDVLLKQASIIKNHSHEDSIGGRICDDKFALFVRKSRFDENKFKTYIDAIQKLTESTIYQMHILVGIYEPQNAAETPQSMYSKALMAMNEISGNYNKSFAYYDSTLMDKILIEKNIINDFEMAMEQHQISMYLQPIINTKNNTFGAEALCRWNHPLRGMLNSFDFLSVLEKAGLIFQLDEYIWNQAASTLHNWNEAGYTNSFISVNVSEKDFYYTDIYKTFTRLVETYDINPSSLHIEITEKVLTSNFSQALALATKLQRFGFMIIIDNFGNGYSSLNMLKDFNADGIKLDMSLLSRAATEERSMIILNAIVNMANLLDIQIIGEGIENSEQYNVLKMCNCYILQGNYLSEPLSVEMFQNRFINYLAQAKSEKNDAN